MIVTDHFSLLLKIQSLVLKTITLRVLKFPNEFVMEMTYQYVLNFNICTDFFGKSLNSSKYIFIVIVRSPIVLAKYYNMN
jgi:hypothetical protein